MQEGVCFSQDDFSVLVEEIQVAGARGLYRDSVVHTMTVTLNAGRPRDQLGGQHQHIGVFSASLPLLVG